MYMYICINDVIRFEVNSYWSELWSKISIVKLLMCIIWLVKFKKNQISVLYKSNTQ